MNLGKIGSSVAASASRQWSVVSGQWSVVSCQLSVVSGKNQDFQSNHWQFLVVSYFGHPALGRKCFICVHLRASFFFPLFVSFVPMREGARYANAVRLKKSQTRCKTLTEISKDETFAN